MKMKIMMTWETMIAETGTSLNVPMVYHVTVKILPTKNSSSIHAYLLQQVLKEPELQQEQVMSNAWTYYGSIVMIIASSNRNKEKCVEWRQ